MSCRTEVVEGREVVRLKVADNGPGVPVDERERIFDRFYRVPGTGGRGSGIGLSLVARIAQMHGGRICVGEGIDGRGFGIWLDFAPAPQPPLRPDARGSQPALAAGHAPQAA